MSFNCPSAKAFTRASIWKNAPEAPGVFGLSDARNWLMIEESNNLRAELMAVYDQMNAFPSGSPPTGFSYEVCDAHMRRDRWLQLTRELSPVSRASRR
ncbi:MAG: hypothetical protein U5J83_14305 [Bryobacterales bacterium]|nr:hypothetical protein [Bryobacterales bacterium]